MVENAIKPGSQQHCPYCQLTDLKNEDCTHMVFEQCGLSWCYLYEMKDEECSVDNDVELSLSAQNQNHEIRRSLFNEYC
jgi:hypothetical protein